MPLVFIRHEGQCFPVSVDAGEIIDTTELNALKIETPTDELLQAMTVKQLLALISNLGLPSSAKKPAIVSAIKRAWSGIMMTQAASAPTSAQSSSQHHEEAQVARESYDANQPLITEISSSGEVLYHGRGFPGERPEKAEPAEPEPEEEEPESWSDDDEMLLRMFQPLAERGINLNSDQRLALENRKAKATDPKYVLLKDLNNTNLNEEKEDDAKVSIHVPTLNGSLKMGYFYNRLTRCDELMKLFASKLGIQIEDVTLKVGDATLEPFDGLDAYVQDKGVIYLLPRLRGGGVQKKLKDAKKLVEISKGSEKYAPVCGNMMETITKVLTHTESNPHQVMDELIKTNSVASLNKAYEVLSRNGNTQEFKIKQSAAHLFGSNGAHFFNLHDKCDAIFDGARSALYDLYIKCEFKSIAHFRDMVKVTSNIKQGEANILSQQDWDLFNQNIRDLQIATYH